MNDCKWNFDTVIGRVPRFARYWLAKILESKRVKRVALGEEHTLLDTVDRQWIEWFRHLTPW